MHLGRKAGSGEGEEGGREIAAFYLSTVHGGGEKGKGRTIES